VNPRVEKLRGTLEEPLLVTSPVNVFYLSGFKSSNAALLVEPERVRLFADFRYSEAGRAVAGVEFEETRRDLLGDLGERLSGRIGFEAAAVSYAGYEKLRAGRVEPVPQYDVVERLRAVKDDAELEAIRRACAITDRVFERLVEETFVGRSERDLAWRIEQLFHDEGGEGSAFETHVSSGPNGATPHATLSDRVIERGETVVVDAGCLVDDYMSDYTRTFATGPLDGELKEAYELVLTAQQAGLGAIRAGVTGFDADAAARRVIEESRFAGTFGHGLGHGLGLLVHEAPRLSPESSDTLEPGNVHTVEPGIYLSGRGGIRIEDDVVVTADGLENLTGFRKDLMLVD
jgi:Xaa-Pro aminopeptidase